LHVTKMWVPSNFFQDIFCMLIRRGAGAWRHAGSVHTDENRNPPTQRSVWSCTWRWNAFATVASYDVNKWIRRSVSQSVVAAKGPLWVGRILWFHPKGFPRNLWRLANRSQILDRTLLKKLVRWVETSVASYSGIVTPKRRRRPFRASTRTHCAAAGPAFAP
jgi:hypothetical protein